MKRANFKSIVNRSLREAVKKHLKSLKELHSKSKGLDEKLQVQPYLHSNEMSLQEKQLLFKLRTYTYDCKANFKNKFQSDIKCINCSDEDTQEHLLRCSIADGINCSEVKHEDIFGNLKSQVKVVKVMMKIHDRRKLVANNSPLIGSHVHFNPMLGA